MGENIEGNGRDEGLGSNERKPDGLVEGQPIEGKMDSKKSPSNVWGGPKGAHNMKTRKGRDA